MGSVDGPWPLVVEKSEVIFVKPSKATPHVTLSLSTLDNELRIEFPIETVCIFVPKLNLKGHDFAFILQHALSKALVYYYPFAGKLNRRSDNNKLELNCTVEDGVPFIKATASCTLASVNHFETIDHYETVNQLLPSYPIKGCERDNLLALQITKFACGGITIGMIHHHSICDGSGIAQFFRAILELASGKMTQPTIIPVWDRERLTYDNLNGDQKNDYQIPKFFDLSAAATSPYIKTDEIIREFLSFTAEDITRLKKTITDTNQSTNENDKNVAVTTFEVFAAHIWRARCKALKFNPEGTTYLRLPVNIRGVIEPPLPEGYYGNAVTGVSVALTAKELTESPLSNVVKLIKDAKIMPLKKEYVLGALRETERRLKVNEAFRNTNEAFMMMTDWRNIGLHHDVMGGLVNIIPLISKYSSNLAVLLPVVKGVLGNEGGVRVMASLPKATMAKFKEEMYAF